MRHYALRRGYFDYEEARSIAAEFLVSAVNAKSPARQEVLFNRALVAEASATVMEEMYDRRLARLAAEGRCMRCLGTGYSGPCGDTCSSCEGSGWASSPDEYEYDDQFAR